MSVRKATASDLQSVLAIYERARSYMRSTGNPSQWGSVYPPVSLVISDLEGGNLFVLDGGDGIYGVFAFFPEGDSVYDNIDGAWLNSLPHSAIHRVASSGERKGVLGECVAFCRTLSSNLKIDTHVDNKIMQHQLKKAGFVECGVITLPDGEKRIAFQLAGE